MNIVDYQKRCFIEVHEPVQRVHDRWIRQDHFVFQGNAGCARPHVSPQRRFERVCQASDLSFDRRSSSVTRYRREVLATTISLRIDLSPTVSFSAISFPLNARVPGQAYQKLDSTAESEPISKVFSLSWDSCRHLICHIISHLSIGKRGAKVNSVIAKIGCGNSASKSTIREYCPPFHECSIGLSTWMRCQRMPF